MAYESLESRDSWLGPANQHCVRTRALAIQWLDFKITSFTSPDINMLHAGVQKFDRTLL
jgi:hypothetical protein